MKEKSVDDIGKLLYCFVIVMHDWFFRKIAACHDKGSEMRLFGLLIRVKGVLKEQIMQGRIRKHDADKTIIRGN